MEFLRGQFSLLDLKKNPAKQSNLEFLRGHFSPLDLKKISAKGLKGKKSVQFGVFEGVIFTSRHEKNLGQRVEGKKIRL